MEFTEELGVVLENYEYNANSGRIECLQRSCSLLSNNHVVLEEGETAYEKVFDLEPCLVELGLTDLHLFALSICGRLLLFDEVRHKQTV
jgi:hypothetical protein